LIEDFILEMQFHKIGHAMIAPVPNQIFGEETAAKEPIEVKFSLPILIFQESLFLKKLFIRE
jgi:hypothetical protein